MSEQTQSQESQSWPELKGKTWAEAEKYFKENHPNLDVIRTPENSPVTMDLRMDRVRVFVDANDKVVDVPTTG